MILRFLAKKDANSVENMDTDMDIIHLDNMANEDNIEANTPFNISR